MNGSRKSLAVSWVLLAGFPLSALAVPPADSPYNADAQNAYVQDATSDGIANLNMVLCILNAMQPSEMVNAGNYVALVDKNKCDTENQSSTGNATSGASGATAAPDYMTAVVNVTRESNAEPMIGKVWMTMTEEGNEVNISVHLSAEQSPDEAPPYGKFRLDYIGKAGGMTLFNGFIDADGANVEYLETGMDADENALALTATSTSSGSGTMQAVDEQTQDLVTFNFAYNAGETNYPAGVFRRDDGANDVCFDRSAAAAEKSVWRYGTYNANTGERVDQAHPGFPIIATHSGERFYGYASYWGVHFQGLEIDGFPDGELNGVVITDQRPGNSSTYTLSKSSGRLTKWTRNQQTLEAMAGIPFTFWGDITGMTSNGALNGFNGWQMQWNNNTGRFSVIGTQACGPNGCVLSSITPATVNANAFNNFPVSGWSDSFGGNINIPPTGSPHTGNDVVNYYTQSDVIPGSASAPAALHCLSRCPTGQSLTDFVGNNGGSTPFGNGTEMQWQTAPNLANTVDYTFDGNGLKENGSVLAVTDRDLFSGEYQSGIMTGRMFATALVTVGCPNAAAACEPGDPAVYYTWQTGPSPWNQSTWLTKTSNDSVVSFDPPENVSYTVPNGAAYGSWAGKSIQLQFNGFGNLFGIPGFCVDPIDNDQVDCNTANARYVPLFSLPDGATMTLASTNTPIIVKALDAELRLSKVDCGTTSTTLPSNSVALPSVTDVRDPSDAEDEFYIGTKPEMTDAPSVIHGVLQ